MNNVSIDVQAVMAAFISASVDSIGTDPQGWDKLGSVSEHAEFMRVSNHELSIDRIGQHSVAQDASR